MRTSGRWCCDVQLVEEMVVVVWKMLCRKLQVDVSLVGFEMETATATGKLKLRENLRDPLLQHKQTLQLSVDFMLVTFCLGIPFAAPGCMYSKRQSSNDLGSLSSSAYFKALHGS